MADETIGETIAVNLVPDPRLTKTLPGGVNVNQAVLSGGMGVSLEKGIGDGDAYVTPWSEAGQASGDRVCVLIVSSNTLRPDTVSMDTTDGEPLVWLRGANTGYAEVMCVRAKDPALVRLHAPASGVLTVVKSGVFDMDSWTAMQERNIIYFDGGGIIQASESGYTLPPATTGTLGGVIVGDGLQVTAQGVLSVSPQPLPIATQDTAGVVKVGQGLRASADGTLTVRLGDNLSFDGYGNINAAAGGGDVDLSDYYTRAQVDGKFVTKDVADVTYAKKDDIPSTGGERYATERWVEDNFLDKDDYTHLDSQTLTVGGGSAKLRLTSTGLQLVYGNGHVDINSRYSAISFGSYNIMVDSTGVHINGSNGATNF